MRLMRIRDEKDVTKFSERLTALCGIRLQIEYFLSNETYALFDKGEMIGGFAIARAKSMRSFGIVGGDISSTGLSVFEICEANGVWLDNSVDSYVKSTYLWLALRRKILQTGCEGVLMPWIKSNLGLTRFYESFADKIVFEGVPMGNVGHSVELKVGFASRGTIRFRTLKHLPSYLLKAASSKRKSIAPIRRSEVSVQS